VRACDIAVADADHSIAGGLEESGAGGIVGALIAPVVDVPFELHDESFGDAVEINDEAVQDMLAAELEAEHGAPAQQ
jgi:hypothetical protein